MKFTLGCATIGCAIFLISLARDDIPSGARILGMTLALGVWLFSLTAVMFWEVRREIKREGESIGDGQ